MKDLNYVIGRLHGLNELVKILKDLADKKGTQNSEIIAVMADHIAEQLQAILSDFDKVDVQPEHRDVLMELKDKHMPAKKEEEEEPPHKKKFEEEEEEQEEDDARGRLDKHERTVDDLLRDLESLKS